MYYRYPRLLAVSQSRYADWTPSGQPIAPTSNLRHLYGAIENQSKFSDCSAFASLQWRGALRKLAGLPWIRPSYFANYYEERVKEGTLPYDSGATIEDALAVLEQYGAMPDAKDPTENPDDLNLQPPADGWRADLRLHPEQVRRVRPDHLIDDMRDALSRGYPILHGVVCFEEIEEDMVAEVGVLPMPRDPLKPYGGHLWNCIGHDDAHARFLYLNQWSNLWGLKTPPEFQGCCWVPYEYVERYTVGAYIGLPDPVTA